MPEIEPYQAPEPQLEVAQSVETGLEFVGPVMEQGETNGFAAPEPTFAPAESIAVMPEAPAPEPWQEEPVSIMEEPIPAVIPTAMPEAAIESVAAPEPEAASETVPAFEPVAAALESMPALEPEMEPIGQGQPIPYQMSVSDFDSSTTEMTNPPVEHTVAPASADLSADAAIAGLGALRQPVETPVYEVVSEPTILQPTTPVIMPEPVQTPAAPVIRTPTAGGAPQPASTMHTAVQLTFSFEIASMQLTPTFKMGALQLRPSSKIVTMRLSPSQQPTPAMNLQVTFEISKIQPTGGGLGTVRLTPSQQQRPQVASSPSFTVAGLQLVSNFEAAPVQLTPSQQAAVLVTSSFQIATVGFSPSFEIASIVLNATSKQVSVQLPGAGPVEGAPTFEISNLQLGATGDVGMMQINLLGQGPRRA
jgi:hypothetical protein